MADPIPFAGHNVVIAKDQPPYLPLPAYTDGEETITCWRLSWHERLYVLVTGRVWLRVLNFGRPLQPQKVEGRAVLYPEEPHE